MNEENTGLGFAWFAFFVNCSPKIDGKIKECAPQCIWCAEHADHHVAERNGDL